MRLPDRKTPRDPQNAARPVVARDRRVLHPHCVLEKKGTVLEQESLPFLAVLLSLRFLPCSDSGLMWWVTAWHVFGDTCGMTYVVMSP